MNIHLTLLTIVLAAPAVLPARAAEKPVHLEEKCRKLRLSKNPAPGRAEEGAYQITFTGKKKAHVLADADDSVPSDHFKYPKESICSLTAVFPRRDNSFWILGQKDDRPRPAKLVGSVYSRKKDAILATFIGGSYQSVHPAGDGLLYTSILPRTDIGGGKVQFQGRERTCLETELPLIHRVTLKNGGVEDRLDAGETFRRFEYKKMFKDQAEFEKYFALHEPESGGKVRRLVYAIDSLHAPDCIYATAGGKRDCSDLTPESVHCRKR